jgi:hypothetical protein
MGIASLGGLLSGAGDVRTPGAKQTGQAFRGLLNNYVKGLPAILGAQQKFGPQFNALNLSNLGTTTTGLSGILSGALPGAGSLVGNANPGQANLLGQLTQSAGQQLGAGAALDPALARVTQQSIRGGQAARGMGYGPADTLQESSAITSLGDQLRQERQNFAGNVAGMNNQYETQPTLSMLMNLLSSAGTNNATSGPTLVPQSLSSQLMTMPYMAKLQANTTGANNSTSLYQSMDNNSNSFISGL